MVTNMIYFLDAYLHNVKYARKYAMFDYKTV